MLLFVLYFSTDPPLGQIKLCLELLDAINDPAGSCTVNNGQKIKVNQVFTRICSASETSD